MADPIVFPGTVEWSGENPGISLKESPDGPFTTLASLFRVVLSPHGRGHMLMLMQSPQEANPPAERANLCLTDNDALAHYLVDRFVTNFRAFKGLPGMQGLRYRRLDSIAVGGDAVSTYTETLKAGDLNVQLSWNGLGKPFCFALRPEEIVHRKPLHAERFRGMSKCEHHGKRARTAWPADAARGRGSQHQHGAPGILRIVDTGLKKISPRRCWRRCEHLASDPMRAISQRPTHRSIPFAICQLA